MNELLRRTVPEISRFLGENLPRIRASWWQSRVLDRLTEHQLRIIGQRNLSSLDELDLASLLRVMDQNWFEISALVTMPGEGRTWLKELQSVRNRWAHSSSVSPAAEDIYRDADTLARFLQMIGANKQIQDDVAAFKATMMNRIQSVSETFGEQRQVPRNRAGSDRGSVYDPLRDHLRNLQTDRWSVTFLELEDLLGRRLPMSAYKHQAWWGNDSMRHSVQTRAWMDAGWRVDRADLTRRRVSFRKA